MLTDSELSLFHYKVEEGRPQVGFGPLTSRFQGPGFGSNARIYEWGDDASLIDPYLTAEDSEGHYWIREEPESYALPAAVMVDQSARLEWQGASALKPTSRAVLEVAGAIYRLHVLGGSKAQLFVGGARVNSLQPLGRPLHLAVEAAFSKLQVGSQTLVSLLHRGEHRRYPVVFVISDCQEAGVLPRLQRLSLQSKVVVLQVLDREDFNIANYGRVDIDLGQGIETLNTASQVVRERINSAAATQQKELESGLQAYGINHHQLWTDKPLDDQLRALLHTDQDRDMIPA